MFSLLKRLRRHYLYHLQLVLKNLRINSNICSYYKYVRLHDLNSLSLLRVHRILVGQNTFFLFYFFYFIKPLTALIHADMFMCYGNQVFICAVL